MLYKKQLAPAEGAVDITGEVRQAVAASGVQNGLCLVFCPHAEAGLLVMEADKKLAGDVLEDFDRLLPQRENTRHPAGGKAGAAAAKSALGGVSTPLPVQNGQLALPPNMALYFCEYGQDTAWHYYVKMLDA